VHKADDLGGGATGRNARMESGRVSSLAWSRTEDVPRCGPGPTMPVSRGAGPRRGVRSAPRKGAMIQHASEATTPPRAAVAAVEFELTPEDWEDANLAHLKASRLQKQAIGKTRTLFVALFAMLAAMTLLVGEPLAALMLGFAGIGMSALTRPLHEHNLRRAVRRLGRDGVANGTFGPHRVAVTAEGLVNATPSYEWLVRWAAVEEVRLQDGMFLIYIGPNAFMVIPESAFPDGATTRAFADAFYSHAGGSDSLPGRSEVGARPGDATEPVTAAAAVDHASVGVSRGTETGAPVAGSGSAPQEI
jgi:hypothetical protein